MDIPAAIVSAAVGAGVAIGATAVLDQIRQAKAIADRAQYEGYCQGRESVLQNSFNNAEPQDFTLTR